jgi:osmotically-inducible protein OsmY
MPRKRNDSRSTDPEVDSPREAWAGPERRQEPRGISEGPGGPRLRRKSDESLAQEIHEILTSDPALDSTDIEVVVEGGAVTLSGEVEHPDAKHLAEELTESISGVRLVHNRLVVRR